MYKIALFYKYVPIRYPVQLQKWQRRLCEALGLKGRIIIAHEGINATVGGKSEDVTRYVEETGAHELLKHIDFKLSDGCGEDFPRLSVLVKPEIVRLGISPDTLPAQESGRHLTPQEAHNLLQERPKDLVVLDARNQYEWEIGAFADAVKPPIDNFRELPSYLDNNLEYFRDKQVLMYCTGGVRCERASAYLKSKDVARDVMQIEGGIHRYVEEYPNGFFRGKNYVFDGRGAMQVNNDVLGQCLQCKSASDRQVSCSNPSCRQQLIVCTAHDSQHTAVRCKECSENSI
jgi:predicted sulfurtransferase